MKYLYDMHLPLEFILKVGGLSNDIKTDSKNWAASITEHNAQQMAMEQPFVANTTDNSSQE
jgi:hypothetical protein